jgi:thiol:disulfide interchange protein
MSFDLLAILGRSGSILSRTLILVVGFAVVFGLLSLSASSVGRLRGWPRRTIQAMSALIILGVGIFFSAGFVGGAGAQLRSGITRSVSAGVERKRDWPVRFTTAEDGHRYPAMVEFYVEGCAVCQGMQPVVERLREDCHGRRVLVRTVNLSEKTHRGLARRYRLVGVPTFVFLNAQGEEMARLIGKQSPEALKQAVSAVRGQACPNVGALPRDGEGRLAYPVLQRDDEVISCQSTSTSATPVTSGSRASALATSGTTPSAPSATSPAGECSRASP